METYIVSDNGEMTDASVRLKNIIESKKYTTTYHNIAVYGYFKMRQNTSKKGRIPKNHGHNWTGEPNSLHLVSYEYMSDIALGGQEVDHMMSVGTAQQAMRNAAENNHMDLLTGFKYGTILHDLLNHEDNQELVLTVVNSIRIIMVKMFQDGFDAVKVASMLSAFRDLPYQHCTSFFHIQILSDIVRVKANQLLYIIFDKLLTSYSKFAASLRTNVTGHSIILDKALKDTAKYVDTTGALMDPKSVIKKRMMGTTQSTDDLSLDTVIVSKLGPISSTWDALHGCGFYRPSLRSFQYKLYARMDNLKYKQNIRSSKRSLVQLAEQKNHAIGLCLRFLGPITVLKKYFGSKFIIF